MRAEAQLLALPSSQHPKESAGLNAVVDMIKFQRHAITHFPKQS